MTQKSVDLETGFKQDLLSVCFLVSRLHITARTLKGKIKQAFSHRHIKSKTVPNSYVRAIAGLRNYSYIRKYAGRTYVPPMYTVIHLLGGKTLLLKVASNVSIHFSGEINKFRRVSNIYVWFENYTFTHLPTSHYFWPCFQTCW